MRGDQRFSVRDKAILITGASSGFGAHFARVLAGEGAKVGLAARRTDALESVAAEIREAGLDTETGRGEDSFFPFCNAAVRQPNDFKAR